MSKKKDYYNDEIHTINAKFFHGETSNFSKSEMDD